MKQPPDPDLLAQYDFSRGERGKYAARAANGSNIVILDADVQRHFPDSAAVNTALRALAAAVAVTRRPARVKPAARKRAAA